MNLKKKNGDYISIFHFFNFKTSRINLFLLFAILDDFLLVRIRLEVLSRIKISPKKLFKWRKLAEIYHTCLTSELIGQIFL